MFVLNHDDFLKAVELRLQWFDGLTSVYVSTEIERLKKLLGQ